MIEGNDKYVIGSIGHTQLCTSRGKGKLFKLVSWNERTIDKLKLNKHKWFY